MAHSIGDPNHIGVHNELTSDVQTAATEMGVDVDLPPQRNLGDTGHVDDHNLIQAALDKIANEGSAGASWAQVISAPDAVTSSYYDDKGGQWQYWEWNAPGTFDVELSGGLLWVLACGGGGRSHSELAYLDSGQPGLVREGLWEFGPGTHTVTVGAKGVANAGGEAEKWGQPSSLDDFTTQGISPWGQSSSGRGGGYSNTSVGYKSRITGEELEYAPGTEGPDRPGRGGRHATTTNNPGTVIIATRIDVPTLPPAPPRLEVAPVVAKPVTISGPDVQEWLVRDKQGNRKVVYFLPGNTGTARSLALTDEGAAALAARRDVLDAIATTDVPEDFTGDPVTLLPKKLRAELRGFVEVRAGSQPEAVFSVTLGAGVLPGVMVGAGGQGGGLGGGQSYHLGGGGAGGVLGQGAHVPVILPVQGTATYTVTVASTTTAGENTAYQRASQSTTLAVQGQTPFATAVGGGAGCGVDGASPSPPSTGGSGGGAAAWSFHADTLATFLTGAPGVPGQGNHGGQTNAPNGGAGGGYGSRPTDANGGAGFDLATALNLDPNDGLTGSFLDQVSVDGWIAGGGAANSGSPTAGGGSGGNSGHGKDYTGGGGGASARASATPGGRGGAGAVYIITDPT